MITLYDYELSAECYQARLMLSILGLQHDCVDVEFYPSREHESEWFTELSPLHRLPVLQDGATTLHDAQAILVYLAAQHDASGRWYPTGDATLLAEITQWLGFARAFAASAGAARLHETFFQPADIEAARAQAHQMLRVLDDHLWFGEYEARS